MDEYTPPNRHNPNRLGILTADIEKIEATYRSKSQDSFRCFYRGILIESAGKPRIFENVAALFQRKFFEDITPHIEDLRIGKIPDMRRFWVERTKKSSKDADLAIIVLWLLAFPKRPFFGQIGAVDTEQAGVLKDRVSHLIEYNTWLNGYVELVQNEIRSKVKMANGKDPLAKIKVMSADVGGAHGGTPDLLIINELSHIAKWEFASNLFDNADGVPHGMVIIATNAGFKGTPAHVWRNNAITSDNWSVHVWDKPAPWHSKATIEDAKKRNILSRYLRLWQGRWVSGRGGAVSEEAIDKAFNHELSHPLTAPERGWEYVMGVDLGVSHDHSAIAVIGISHTLQLLRLVYWKAWEPSSTTREVNLMDVEEACIAVYKMFEVKRIFYDPFQAVLLSQRLKRLGINCKEMTFSKPSNLIAMASAFVQAMDAKKLICYDDEDGRLRRDFGRFEIVEKSYGFRLESVSDEFGHADVGTAVVIALPYAIAAVGGVVGLSPDDDLVCDDNTPLSNDEWKDMPEELRELYGSQPVEPHASRGRRVVKREEDLDDENPNWIE